VTTPGQWTGGGWWTWGIDTVVYQSLPTPTEAKVVRRQILRNLDGSLDTFYVDIDTDDLKSTTLYSQADDNTLAAREAVPIYDDEGIPFAARYGPPPSHKLALANHQGRVFAAGDVEITAGCVRPIFGAPRISGVATSWGQSLIGRYLYVSGATRAYEISAVDAANQTLTLVGGYLDLSQPYALYAIRPAPAERKLVYYSEAGLPEAWPPWNAVEFPQDGDDIVGLMVKGHHLYVLQRRHIYRYVLQKDPATDGFQFLAAERGVINNRCWVKVEGNVYLMDEVGIYAFDGDAEVQPISAPIQSLFQGDPGPDGLSIDFSADQKLWHAAHDPPWHTIRWYVAMVGDDPSPGGLLYAICYDYRAQRWWIENYPHPVMSSAVAALDIRRGIAGSDARRVACFGSAVLDGADPTSGTMAGMVSSATSTTLSDSLAVFPGNVADYSVRITSGTGRGQLRIIASNTSNQLEVVEPWDAIPDTTSSYQIGGISWKYRTGWHEYHDDEQSNARDLAFTYAPLQSDATLTAQVYFDHSDEPVVWSYDASQDGITTVNGSPYIDVSLKARTSRSGWSLNRMGGHNDSYAYGPLYMSLGLSGIQAAERIKVYTVSIAGVLPSESQND
jgi:hypothetical protein